MAAARFLPTIQGMQAATPAILVIDDNDAVRSLIASILEMMNVRTLQAQSGEEGIEIAQRNSCDAIMCDIYMPGIGGLETIRRLRSDPQTAHVPAIVISGHPDGEDAATVKDLGVHCFIGKPFTFVEVINAVRGALKLNEQETLSAA